MDRTVTPNYNLGWKDSFIVGLFHFINKFVSWDKLPSYIGALNLEALRIELRQYNLHDGYASGAEQGTAATCPMTNARFKDARSSDGTFNSTDMPRMGCAGMRFGRNFPRQLTAKPSEAELMTPNPRMLSERFMKRKKFIPATTLNLIAAAWIQFQTHDWFFHEDDYDNKLDISLPSDESSWPDKEMKLPRTKPDDIKSESDKKCPGYRNMNTAWWDSSQIYGSSEATTRHLRNAHPDGELKLVEDKGCKFLPREVDGKTSTGFNDNWWIGMELLHTLFALEHNAICQMLRKKYPKWGGDEIFDKARLINCALMAKIHTVEWTPGILAHPTLQVAMAANWWGILGESLYKLLGRVSKTSEAISGIPGSGIDHQGVPYSLTEEFVSVYRLHTLCPDNIAFFDSQSGKWQATVPVKDTLFTKSRSPVEGSLNFADAFYSFGINYPGAIVNHNYPDFLRDLVTPDGIRKDLGTIDILRDRERGVPRYTEFRRLLRMPVPKTFEELTGGDKALAADLSNAYGGKIELVDAIIGSHSEPVPKGFGFSDMAFRIFVLMASRRLKSDRFIANQWNTQTYTKEGMDWVQNSGMKDVLLRHYPELAPVLKNQKNVFAPWQQLPESKKTWHGPETNAP